MSAHTELLTLLPGMTAFPEAADIFVADQPWLAEHLLPLLSIDLGLVKPELAGTLVHMLCPIEPLEGWGCIGEGTEAFHNRFTGFNWFACELTAGNRYRFLGEEGYFRLSSSRDALEPQELAHVQEMRESYTKARTHHAQHGRLASFFGDGRPTEWEYLDHLGGEIWDGNWVGTGPIPEAFAIVGDVPAYNWCAAGADSILLFYEPERRTALFTFDWT